jgi:hypothetical protein
MGAPVPVYGGVPCRWLASLPATTELLTIDAAGQVSRMTVPLSGVTDHGALDGLGDDDHPQYTMTLGRSGGQTQVGGTGSGQNLTLQSTSHATRGVVESLDPLVAPAGTSSLAGMRHAGMASNTGWYAITATNLALLITGAERYRFGSAGHFGAAAGVTVGNSPGNPHAALMGVSAGVARITTNNFSTRAKLEVADFDASGTVIVLSALPTIDPGVAGRLWRDGTTLKVSI